MTPCRAIARARLGLGMTLGLVAALVAAASGARAATDDSVTPTAAEDAAAATLVGTTPSEWQASLWMRA